MIHPLSSKATKGSPILSFPVILGNIFDWVKSLAICVIINNVILFVLYHAILQQTFLSMYQLQVLNFLADKLIKMVIIKIMIFKNISELDIKSNLNLAPKCTLEEKQSKICIFKSC